MNVVAPKTQQRLWVVVLFWLLLAVGLFAFNSFVKPSVASNQVRLKAGPFNNEVQMFERVGRGDEGKVTYFPSGTLCTKIGGPSAVDFGDGDVLYFNKLTCQSVTGYVNAKWVTLD